MEHRYPLPDGTDLEDYRIEESIGSGGFGIYAAEDRRLRRRVVIKGYLPDELATRDGIGSVHPNSGKDQAIFQ